MGWGGEGLLGAFADRYRIEREVGHGAMARVYLARDQRYDKPVAVKVLNLELSAALGTERFLREIDILAHLNHPHILPLLDSGETEGSLFYVMPYVAGESLRHRLRRETQLRIADAIAIARDVAGALDYAHRQGIVHRDIKPENILMSEGLALVADFGIARAITLAADDDRITQSGVSPGTPPYMSPEQASGDGVVDGRSDIYGLGCVLYELLAGQPPFTGPTAQAVLARHLADPVPPLHTVRKTVPLGVERAVLKALEKVPAHRFGTAGEFADALTAPARRRAFPFWIAAAGVMLLAAVVYLQYRRPTELDPGIVAVLPFRVAGDSALGYLREGMLDLLAAKLTGQGGLAATDPQTVMRGWRRVAGQGALDVPRVSALRLAQRLGAGKALMGSIVGTPHRMIFSANLVRVPGGQSLGTATVQGPIDSLLMLVDRLTAQLLAREAGLDEPKLADVTSTSLSALRLYLNGQSAYRRGHYEDAVLRYREALAQDSTFALAALGLRYATGWIGSSPETGPVWALRGRLSARDRTMLEGLVGPRYPELSSEREFLTAWEAAVTAAPAEAEAWYELGDALYHAGSVLGEDPVHVRARGVFQRAVQLDSDFTAPIVHLIDLAAQAHDTASLRRLGALYFARDSGGEIVDYLHWRLATALGDTAALARLSARMPAMPGESLRRILAAAQLDGIQTPDADSAASAWVRSSHTSLERWFALLRYHDLELNRGETAAALALTDSLRAVWPRSHAYLRIQVADALYDVGDTAAARGAVALLTPAISAALPDDKMKRAEQYADVCTVEQWRLEHGITRSAPRSIAELLSSSSQRDGPEADSYNRWCAIALQAWLASATSRTEGAPLRSLDSLLATGPRPLEIAYPDFFRSFVFGSVLAARLHERRGDVAAASAAIQRRANIGAGATFLASSLRTEGRLAALMGDRARAIRADRHYLVLRSRPERDIAQEVSRVRMELAALERP